MKKLRDKLRERYKKQIEQWDWKAAKAECDSNPQLMEETVVGMTWIGSQMGLFPSGKYYTCWTTNQSKQDVIRDQAFVEALTEVVEENDLFLQRGEGDPTDIYVGLLLGSDEDIFYQDDNGYFWHSGEKIAETEEEVKAWMEEERYWPNVWFVSDHGNVSRYQFDE